MKYTQNTTLCKLYHPVFNALFTNSIFIHEMEQSEGNCVEIIPKTKFLSASELVCSRHIEIEEFKLGLKRTTPSEETFADETNELDMLYAQLRQQLSVQRVERLDGRSLAIWEADTQSVRVLKKDGKFHTFGYSSDGKDYLEFYEALFLLEINRLQLEYQSVPVSIEQAYLLLLGEDTSPKYDEYLVYSTLSRAGYIVVKHQNKLLDESERPPANENECIWELLWKALQNKPLSERVKNSELLPTIKEGRDAIRMAIMNQTISKNDDIAQDVPTIDAQKAKPCPKHQAEIGDDEASTSKRMKFLDTTTEKSLIDCLLSEPEFAKFRKICHQFDVIKLLQNDNINADADGFRKFEIYFDAYLHNSGFKKSIYGIPPLFRVVILSASELFPSHDEITVCYRQQLCLLPLVVVSVSESRQIHAFLYHFS